MFSLVNSSDPPCFSTKKITGSRANEEDSEKQFTSNFSIRDHVYASRSRSIGKSWPFPSQLLQLCMKHGVQNLLPPFEPPNSVRTQHCFSRSSASSEAEIVVPNAEPFSIENADLCLPIEDVHLRHSDKQVNDICEIGSTVTNHCDIERSQNFEHRLVLKPRPIIFETIQADEASAASSASDIMASKVCPVCKAFSSTSNTTLNAHMDQCLSLLESGNTLAQDKLQQPKFKEKSRKKRLMEEIYATAPSCTLEELDRRNGSTWATDLAVVLPTAETNLESGTPKLSPLCSRDNAEGAVYVDSNGIKLRILSKLDDEPRLLSREELNPKKNTESIHDQRIILIKKKKHLSTPFSKKMRFKLRSRRFSSLNLLKNEVQPGSKVVHQEESHLRDEESPVQLTCEADRSFSCESAATLKNWPCSKRSNLPKKDGKKDIDKILEVPITDCHMVMPEAWKPASGSHSAAKSHSGKRSHLSESNSLEFLFNAVQNKENQEKKFRRWKSAPDTPTTAKSHFGKLSELLESKAVDCPSSSQKKENHQQSFQRWPSESTSTSIHLRLSRAMGSLESSLPSSTSEESCKERKRKSLDSKTNKRSSEICHLPLKTKRVSTLCGPSSCSGKLCRDGPLVAWNGDSKVEVLSSDFNARQHRSIEAITSGYHDEHVANNVHMDTLQTKVSEMQTDHKTAGLNSFKNGDSSCMIPSPSVCFEMLTNIAARENDMPLALAFLDKQGRPALDNLEKSHGDLWIDITGKNSTKDPLIPTQQKISAHFREASASPSSTATTVPSPSPRECPSQLASVFSTVQRKPSFPLPLKDAQGIIDIERNKQVDMDATMKKPHQLSGYHPCCCSWQSVFAGSMADAKPRPLPNLLIRPNLPSFYAHSNFPSDMPNAPSLESPTESVLTKACSDVGSISPPPCGTPSQSASSNSILRLMGKDLMVVNNEESSQLPKVNSPVKDSSFNAQAPPSPLGFTSYASFISDATSLAVHAQSPPMTGLHGFQQKIANHKGYKAEEVIVIDDSERPFNYLPHNSPLFSRNNGILQPVIPIKHGSTIPAPHFPLPFVFRSPSTAHFNSQFYYPQSLR